MNGGRESPLYFPGFEGVPQMEGYLLRSWLAPFCCLGCTRPSTLDLRDHCKLRSGWERGLVILLTRSRKHTWTPSSTCWLNTNPRPVPA